MLTHNLFLSRVVVDAIYNTIKQIINKCFDLKNFSETESSIKSETTHAKESFWETEKKIPKIWTAIRFLGSKDS